MADEFVQGPPPKGIKAVEDEFVQGPPPSGVKPANDQVPVWQTKLKDYTLSNGSKTKLREDNAVYLDEAQTGQQRGYQAPGWYQWDQSKKTFVPTSDEPAKQKAGFMEGLGNRVLNAPMPFSPGGMVRMIREPIQEFNGSDKKPWAIEKVLADPTLGSALKGASSLVSGPTQFAAHMAGSNAVDPTVNAIDSYYKSNLVPSTNGEMIGQALPFIFTAGASAAPSVASKAGTIGNVVKYAGNVIKGGITGAVSAPLLTSESDIQNKQEYWDRKKKESLVGGVLGSAIPAVAPAFEWSLGKASNALAGTKLGDMLGIKTIPNPKYAGASELSSELDKAGITNHTVGDVTGDPVALSHEAALARKDPRMMELRLKENQQGTAYADKIVSDLKNAVKSEGWENIDQLQAAADAGGKRSGEAKALLTAIDNSGDDWKRIAQNGGNLKLFSEKLKADQLYDKAGAIAKLYGDVKPTKFTNSIDRNIREIDSVIGSDDSIVPYLKKLSDGIESGNGLGFEDLRQTRSILNRKISSLTNPNSPIQDADAARKALGNVVNALESDIDTYANSHSSGLRNAWKAATEHYKNNVVPYKDAEMGKILADQDPLALGRLFNGKDTYAQQRMFGLLDKKGQAAVRSGLIEDAVSAGDKIQSGVMSPTMSAARVSNALDKLAKNGTMDIAFPGGQDRWAATGLGRIMRTIAKSDTVSWTPPTGESIERMGGEAMGLTTNPMKAADKAVNWLNRDRLFKLYSDPKGRALLIKASTLKEGSPAMKSLINQVPRIVTSEASSIPQNEPTQSESETK